MKNENINQNDVYKIMISMICTCKKPQKSIEYEQSGYIS